MALAVVPIVSCGGAGSGRAVASSELSAAVDRMAALRSVRIIERATGPNTTNHVVTIDFEPPDRVHSVQAGADGSESFSIGSTLYMAEPQRPGYFRPFALPANRTSRNLLSFLQALKGEPATRRGDTYRVTAPGGSASATVKVHNGYIVEFASEAAGVRTVQSFSLFDKAPAVIEPPPDHILPALPNPPKCTPEQPAATLCVSSGFPSDEQPVQLPPVPPDFVPSDLQIRAVVRDGAGCSTEPRNPDASSTVRLNDSSGHCYELGASELTVVRAQATAAHDPRSEAIIVEFKLGAPDAATFNQLAHRHLGERVAIVMFGRVLSAPTVQTDEFQGTGQITGLDPTGAAEVIASLAN